MAVALQGAVLSRVPVGGRAITAIYGPIVGGLIANPPNGPDQGLASSEPLYVDFVNPASLHQSRTTIRLQPGDFLPLPANLATNVSVNAASGGHTFSVIIWREQPGPLTLIAGPFPPSGPQSLQKIIPSYLYQEYSDDDDLQAFVASYNSLAQQYIDLFNSINLPVYTGPLIVGALLDWIAEGLYGLARPALSSGKTKNEGPFNSYALNSLPFNKIKLLSPENATATSDDAFKRIITWMFYKGDGKVFDIRWLKRRIMRFLQGANGTGYNIDNTYRISVTFGVGNQVAITIMNSVRQVTGGAFFNMFAPNTTRFNGPGSTLTRYAPFPMAELLQEAINTGVCELPFQFSWVVNIR